MGKTLGKIMLLPYVFVLMNWAPVASLYHFVRGGQMGIWNPSEHGRLENIGEQAATPLTR
jgi:hypothetical protein